MSENNIQALIEQIQNGIKYEKCWKCACHQNAVNAIDSQLAQLKDSDRDQLAPVLAKAKTTFVPQEYDCLGCKTCFPAIATNLFNDAYPDIPLPEDGCADQLRVEERSGWPPLPGNYRIGRYQAPVAVCTLNSKELIDPLMQFNNANISIVGSLNTENLGIERIIKNTLANSHIRFLIVCGVDSEQRIGHLPGQSLVSLFQHGVDERGRIIEAKGKRPRLKNIDRVGIEQFTQQVELVDMIGCTDETTIIQQVEACKTRDPGQFQAAISSTDNIPVVTARPPTALTLDPKGYFVIYPDPVRGQISVEHYHNEGNLNQIIEGTDIASIYMTVIEMGLLSRLDHACYFGKELALANASLTTGTPYVQDKAQDLSASINAACGPKGCC